MEAGFFSWCEKSWRGAEMEIGDWEAVEGVLGLLPKHMLAILGGSDTERDFGMGPVDGNDHRTSEGFKRRWIAGLSAR